METNRKILKVLIISIGLVLSLVAGVWVPSLLQSNGAWEQDDHYQDTLLTSFDKSVSDIPEYSSSVNNPNIPADPPEIDQTEKNDNKKAVLAELENPELTEIIGEVKTKLETELDSAETMDWIDQRIMETGAEVDPKDLEDFRLIVGMLDMHYVEGLVEEGLNETSLEELRSYLYAQLGEQYYQRAKELFQIYQHLLYLE